MINKHDFLSKYFSYASEFLECPPSFINFLAIATLGSVIGRSRYITFSENIIYPNFWLILLGKSGITFKSSALNTSARCIYAVNPALKYPTDFSVEAMIDTMQETPHGVFFYSEFKSLTTLMERDYMVSAKSFLTELYDKQDDYERTIKGKTYRIQKPCVSIIAASTVDWFTDSLSQIDINAGWLNRFMFVPGEPKENIVCPPHPADKSKKIELYRMLSEYYEANKNVEMEMEMDKSGEKLYSKWTSSFFNELKHSSERYISLFNRMQIHFLKIAIVIEIANNPASNVITEKSFIEAEQYINFLVKSLKELCSGGMTFGKYEKREKRVLDIIKKKGEITRSELLTASHMSSQYFDTIIQTLLEKHLITTENKKEPPESKKSSLFYKLYDGKEHKKNENPETQISPS